MRRLLLILVTAVTVAAACGRDVDPATLLARTAARTAEAGTSRVSLRLTLEGAGVSAPAFAMTASGFIDHRADRAKLELTLPETGGFNTGKASLVAERSVVYMRMAGLGTPDKPWVRIDSARAGASLPGFGQLGSSDPSSVLESLRGVSGTIRRITAERVRGVDTTRYRATVDIKNAMADLPPESRPQVDQLAEMFDAETFPIDVWLDDEGRARRVSLRFEMAEGVGALESVTELYDFGVPVDIDIPPAAEVSDFEPSAPNTATTSVSVNQ